MDNEVMKIELGTLAPDFEIEPLTDSTKYGKMRQDSVINALSLVSSKTSHSIDEITGAGIIDIKNGKASLEIIIQKFSNTKLKQSTSKLLTLFNMVFTENGSNNNTVIMPLEDVARALGLKNKNKARETINKDLEALFNLYCTGIITLPNGQTETIDFRITDAKNRVKNSLVMFKFSEAMGAYLKKCKIMPVPYRLLQIESNSQQNPYTYPLGKKVCEQMKLNQYDKHTKEKKETCIISVAKLLEVCINYGMPTYEQVKNGSRRLEEQIIKPFERDLDACRELFKWEYCKSGGEALTQEELENRTYKEYITRYIKITYPKDYPIEDYNAKKAKKTKKTTAKKEKAKKE